MPVEPDDLPLHPTTAQDYLREIGAHADGIDAIPTPAFDGLARAMKRSRPTDADLEVIVQPADTGHTWRITVELRPSTIVTGDEHHRDCQTFSAHRPVEVRAWNLRDALHAAAELPLTEFFEPESLFEEDGRG